MISLLYNKVMKYFCLFGMVMFSLFGLVSCSMYLFNGEYVLAVAAILITLIMTLFFYLFFKIYAKESKKR